jgi:PAS domain S-box-containing protein
MADAPEYGVEFTEYAPAYLVQLINHSPVATLLLNAEHEVQICNQAFERLFLYSESELKAGNLQEMIAMSDMAPEAIDIWLRVLARERVNVATQRRRKDGTLVEVEIYGIPVVVEDVLRGVIAIYQDVSHEKVAEQRLHHISARLLELQDEERRRIARELHDTTAQTMFALTINLTRLQGMTDSGQAEAQAVISDSLQLAESSAKELRTMAYLLHPPLLEEMGLLSALRWYARGFSERSGIEVELVLPVEMERLPRQVEIALFRVVQEALTNVHRHSASAVAVIHMVAMVKRVVLEIRDQGRGMDVSATVPARLGVGIAGMRERIHQLQGQLELVSGAQGTTVRVVLPLD